MGPGFVVRTRRGRPHLVGTVEAVGGRVVAVHWLLDPDELHAFDAR